MNVKKGLLALLCMVAIVVTTVFGTLAYLTSTDTAVNTFTVGNVKIKLDEAKVNGEGKPVNEEGKVVDSLDAAERVKENTYHLLPGMPYTKDPTVTVLANSEKSYVRMLVTVTYLKEADRVLADHNYVSWFDWDSNWEKMTNVETTKTDTHITRTYEFRYKDPIAKSTSDTKLPALFTEITVPGEINNAELATLAGLKIDVEAQAIQAAGFDDANHAWSNFTK